MERLQRHLLKIYVFDLGFVNSNTHLVPPKCYQKLKVTYRNRLHSAFIQLAQKLAHYSAF